MTNHLITQVSAPVVSRAGDQPFAGGIRFALSGEQTGGLLDLGTEIVHHHEGPPMHVHDDLEEYVLVLSGSLRCRLDGTDLDLDPGDAAVIPRGVEHTFTNLHEEDCRVIWVISPGGFLPFLSELDAAGTFDPAVVGPIAARHGHRFTGPPLAPAGPSVA